MATLVAIEGRVDARSPGDIGTMGWKRTGDRGRTYSRLRKASSPILRDSLGIPLTYSTAQN
ncbi:hypothetical protein AMJ71_00585 [candidate division TA06 bacterium SM1_40]|uniref:Uncharacterized protein n=1 Tax=candidate division TA06 bacterium SM1_40 TaxID=1703773 RepID=A0A0S8JS78_UNCT6|nr:MAG: hypothetical protein AMJ71_00585 [candidate division TA06 bacterium SM1_40]